MPRGLKVFDVWGELHLDKDEVRQALRAVPGEMGADADRAGRDLGRKMTDGLARSVEASSARLTKARRGEVEASKAVQVAELRLGEAREKGNQPASKLLTLENALEKAHYRLAQAQSNTVTSTKKLEDAQHRLASSMGDDLDKKLGPRMQRSGDDAGGKLALGMRMSVIRNSPLIVAAIGAGLAAGGPLVMAGATALFAGIGIVAAAQSQKVQSAWLGTWEHVKAGTIASASGIEPVLTGMAGRVAKAFDQVQPALTRAFSAAAPQIAVFSKGIIDLGQNALPGLVRAVERGMPVTQGFADFLAKTGTGLSDFFDRISTHGPAAGQVWSQLGTAMGSLLPTLGELIGQGAELAADVLPLMNSGLGLVLRAVTALGPALPVVVAGFTAFKVAQAVTGWVSGLGGALDGLAKKTGVASISTGKIGTALSAVGAAAPLVGVGVGLIGVAMERSAQEAQAWSEALGRGYQMLNSGGAAAASAQAQFDALSAKVRDTGSSFDITGGAARVISDQMKDARAHAHDLWEQMDPLAQAQAKVAEWTNTLSFRLQDENASAKDVAIAKERLKYWSDQQSAADDKLQAAIHGVTDAMIAQADQAMAAIDSGFAYRNSVNQLEDAQKALADAQAHVHDANKATRTSSEDVQRAQLAVEQQTYRTALAYGQQQADLSGLAKDSDEYKRFVQESMLSALMQLRQSAGPGMRAAIDQQISALRAGGVSIGQNTNLVNTLTRQVSGLTGQIHAVPGQKYVRIDAPTAAQIQQLRNLGYTVTHLPGGAVRVGVTGVAAVEGAINYAARDRFATVHLRQVGAALATGGSVDVAAGITKAATGRVVGPGTGTSDSVPAIGPNGAPWALSAGEWIVKAMSAGKYGPARMQAVNDGRATVLLPSETRQRRFAGGAPNPVTGTGHTNDSGGVTIEVGNLNVTFAGTDFTSDRPSMRRAAVMLREELIKLERERA